MHRADTDSTHTHPYQVQNSRWTPIHVTIGVGQSSPVTKPHPALALSDALSKTCTRVDTVMCVWVIRQAYTHGSYASISLKAK
jgi:hypothetical protein